MLRSSTAVAAAESELIFKRRVPRSFRGGCYDLLILPARPRMRIGRKSTLSSALSSGEIADEKTHFPALRILSADSGAGGRLRGAGATQVNWAYALSGVLAVLLLLYLLVALIWAEDL